MNHYAGLDVSVKERAICIVDKVGRICREPKVVGHPEDLSKALTETGFHIERVGLEAGRYRSGCSKVWPGLACR